MKQRFLIIALILFSSQLFSQNTDKILEEAYLLYYSERASWIGTDIFLAEFPEKRELIKGYFSYPMDDHYHCVFFDKDSVPGVLATIQFDSTFQIDNVKINTDERTFTDYENELYQIRTKAIKEMYSDTLFKFYKNTNLNPIPIIHNKEKKVYVLTGPEISGIVIFGNDYLITFDRKNNVKSKKSLHKNILIFEYDEGSEGSVSYHSHLKSTGDLITPTDICTLLLYEEYPKWKQHIVISDKYVSIWNCETDTLFVLTKKAWDRISEHQANE